MAEPDKATAPNKGLKGICSLVNGDRALVILTGMQEHSGRYITLAKYLNKQGIDVYVYDLIGQGENIEKPEDLEDWPIDAFDIMHEAINSQIEACKEKGQFVYLMGHSCGSFITQGYIEKYPDSADGYILMGSNGPNRMLYSAANLLAHLLVHKGNEKKTGKLFNNLSFGPYSKAFKEENDPLSWLSVNGVNKDTYRDDPLCGQPCKNSFWKAFFKGLNETCKKKNLRKVSKDSRILILSGSQDPVGEMGKGVRRLEKTYKDLGVKDVTTILYEGYRHEILNEDCRGEVCAAIGEFIRHG